MRGFFIFTIMKNPLIPGLGIPVRTIYCIGRNFVNHAMELGSEIPKRPVIFLKPLSSICYNGASVQLTPLSSSIHYEGEIVVAIGKKCRNISKIEALSHIAGMGCGIDFTARDLQKEAKEKGLPWSVSKGFENFAPISNFKPFDVSTLLDYQILLHVDEEIKQSGIINNMIFSVPYLISYLSFINTLFPGDLIFTGTPKGTGPVSVGNVITASIPKLGCSVTVTITK